MRKFRIKPDINLNVQVWTLERKKCLNWVKVFSHVDPYVVKKMKDHLLLPITIYTVKNNVPEKPVRTVSGWPKPKTEKIRIKKDDLPDSLRY